MRITVRIENETPMHVQARIWVNGGLSGVLTLRLDEVEPFERILRAGLSGQGDLFRIEYEEASRQ